MIRYKRNKIIEKIKKGEYKLFVIYGNKKIPTNNTKCLLCGADLVLRKCDEGIYKLSPCCKCLPSTNVTSIDKLRSMLDENEYNINELYNELSKYKTRKLPKDSETSRKAGKIAWIKTLRKHPEKISTRIEYWLNKGYSKEEAKIKLKDKQTTFSKEKCIKKYGVEEGLKRWYERQKKWQNTLNSKSPEEKIRIQTAKFYNLGYSKISQELFWNIYERIKKDFTNIYFATKDKLTDKKVKINNEYTICCGNNVYRLDFFIEDCNLCIEFDGKYWHSIKNIEKDKIRDDNIKKYGIKILHIPEMEYRDNKQKVIDSCVDWINENRNWQII